MRSTSDLIKTRRISLSRPKILSKPHHFSTIPSKGYPKACKHMDMAKNRKYCSVFFVKSNHIYKVLDGKFNY